MCIQDLRVVSRTWTPAGDGTMGQGIPGIPNIPATDPVVVAGLESSPRFRTNLGFTNASLNRRETIEVEIFEHWLEPAGTAREDVT